MLLDGNQARQCLNRFDFARLFVEELGWDHYRQSLRVTIDQRDFTLEGVAALCGFAVLVCRPAGGGALPAYTERQRIDREVTKQLYEHLIIFVDADRQRQEWQWVRRESGRPPRPRTFTYRVGDRADLLLQRLDGIRVDLKELAELGLPDVTQRVRASFDLEPVTRAFYRRFETERAAFAKFLSGIPDDGLQRWYVSVMLNRLMFIYFVQQKGFLAGDRDYLTTKLTESRERGP
ncbi:MAG: SAM-dependent methyltransferase, partial [Armatimonadetes bacterium]|nr:SAM-dependent methyltransferase [Armatimonadota bacterium]